MHELGLARNIVSIIGEHAKERRVSRIRLVLGPLACVEKQSLDFCFGIISENTSLEGAKLEFIDGEGDQFTIQDFDMEDA